MSLLMKTRKTIGLTVGIFLKRLAHDRTKRAPNGAQALSVTNLPAGDVILQLPDLLCSPHGDVFGLGDPRATPLRQHLRDGVGLQQRQDLHGIGQAKVAAGKILLLTLKCILMTTHKVWLIQIKYNQRVFSINSIN